MNPIIEYAGAKPIPLRKARPAADCLFLGPLPCVLMAWASGAGAILFNRHPNFGDDIPTLIFWGAFLGAAVGLFYGGTLLVFEKVMGRRVQFKRVLVWVIPVSFIAGILLAKTERYDPALRVLAGVAALFMTGVAVSIATAKPVVLAPYLLDDPDANSYSISPRQEDRM